MKKAIIVSLFLSMIFFTSSSYAIKVLEGEALFTSLASGKIYVDYTVSTTPLDGGLPAGSFVFSDLNGGPGFKGTKALYDISAYYYYYQLENNSLTSLTTLNQLTLNLNAGTVLTAGYILGSDLDDVATFDHNIVGDNEDIVVDRPPDDSDFDSISFPQNQTWSFSSPELAIGAESTVLFITCERPPVFSPAFALDGTPFAGDLPIPGPLVPEPFSMVLLGSSLMGLFMMKRK